MRDLLPCPPCGRQGRPGQGFLAGFIERPRGSAPRERDHRGGDHPVPSRTRQLSPPSPRVLQRKAAGGQGVALAEGAFLYAPRGARRGCPLAGLSVLRARTASGPCAFAVPSAAHRRRTRRIAWEAVEGPLRSRARSTADGRVSCPCRPATGVLSRGPFQRFGEVSASRAALRALPASFRAAGSLAGPVLLAASVGGSVWAPSRAFLRQRGSNNLTVVARLALSRRSAVSKGLRPGCPPL